MHKIGDDTLTADVNGEFTEGNPATNTPATDVKEVWLNSLQRELIEILDRAEIQPSQSVDNQLITSLSDIFAPAIGLQVHQTTPASLNITVSSGTLQTGGVAINHPADTQLAIAVPTTNVRIDRIIAHIRTGALSVLQGAESPTPSAPAIPAWALSLAQVQIFPGATEVVKADITNERPSIFKPKMSGALVYRDAPLSINSNTETNFFFDETLYDDEGIHQGGPVQGSFLQVPAGVSAIKLYAHGMYSFVGTSVGSRSWIIHKFAGSNGLVGDIYPGQSNSPFFGDGRATLSTPKLLVSPGDSFQLRTLHIQGSPLPLLTLNGGDFNGDGCCWFAMEIVE